MISYFKRLVNKRQFEIILTASIILISLISFGLGRLTVPDTKKTIIIEQPASIISHIPTSTSTTNQSEKQFVASAKGTKYHWPDCPSAKKISPENQIWFSSEAQAQAAGYTLCANCQKRQAGK